MNLRTGHATKITLVGAADVVNGDGLFRIGRTLYVVQNRLNLISVFDLDSKATTATLTGTITDPRFDVPTTAARFGNRLYLVNARFTSPRPRRRRSRGWRSRSDAEGRTSTRTDGAGGSAGSPAQFRQPQSNARGPLPTR